MNYKITSISPEGRTKYGRTYSSKNTRNIASTVYNSGGSTTPIVPVTEPSIFVALSKTSSQIEGRELSINDITETINVLGYLNDTKTQTYVGNISTTIESTTYGITGIATNGMTISVSDNGTVDTKISITYSRDISNNTGTLYIPINIYTKGISNFGNDISAWNSNETDCKTLILEYTWGITQSSTSAYVLELTNDSTQINCDKDGNIYTDAERPTCEAKLYYGTELVDDATYEIELRTSQNVQGVDINTNTGVITFNSNFSFNGKATEIKVKARYLGEVVATKIMSISKSYAGADGSGESAISRWIVPSVDSVVFDPIRNEYKPSNVTAEVWKQVGTNEPELDTDSTLYYGFDTQYPANVYTTGINVDYGGTPWGYLKLALKNARNEYYISQSISLLKDGERGEEGTSTYLLVLTNTNASINCDEAGNFLSNAVMPTCKATLYQGKYQVENVEYTIAESNTDYSGVSIDSYTGIMTFTNSFTWNTDFTTLELTIAGTDTYYNITTTAIMTISRNYGGENAVSYWIDFNYNQVQVDKQNTVTPTLITAIPYRQVGNNAPEEITDAQLKYSYDVPTYANVWPSTGLTTTNVIGHNSICVGLYLNNALLRRDTISVLYDGKDGQNGQNGDSGLQGPAIRGPIDYWSQDGITPRRWSNGHYSDANHPEDALYLDIIIKDGVYYYCNESHTDVASQEAWNRNASKWTQAEKEFDFIATKLLLAENGKINLLTNNQLLLVDGNDNVTAGMKGGDDINFWAGSMVPADANFQVWNDGTVVAKKGSFGCLEIVENPNGYDALEGTWISDDGNTTTTEYSQRRIKLENTYQSDTKTILLEPDSFTDSRGDVVISTTSTDKNFSAIYTEGTINAQHFKTERGIGIGNKGFHLEVRFIGKATDFSVIDGVICFKGNPILHDTNELIPFSVTTTEFNSLHTNSNGEWEITRNYQYIPLGVYSESHSKENGIIYITL